MVLLIGLSVQKLPSRQKTVHLVGHGVAPRVKCTVVFAVKTEKGIPAVGHMGLLIGLSGQFAIKTENGIPRP